MSLRPSAWSACRTNRWCRNCCARPCRSSRTQRCRECRNPTKFEAAYDAILFAALAVFAAQGYRITAAQGHHRIALEGLVGSIGGSQLLLDELDGLLSIRNEKYTGFATVRAPDMRLALEHARRILDDTSHWLREHFPGMLKP
ncbi:hypothetical protein CBM2626_B130112 [Cupriavidus taiwanensis]|nr:hypothetical protein CBM2626_B130112 [Cupriavidus taiwanensis]